MLDGHGHILFAAMTADATGATFLEMSAFRVRGIQRYFIFAAIERLQMPSRIYRYFALLPRMSSGRLMRVLGLCLSRDDL